MIAGATRTLETSTPAVENSIGPRPLSELLPAVLARYGISHSQPGMVPPSGHKDSRDWLQLEVSQLVSTANCVAVG